MKKKLTSLLLAAVMTAALTACGGTTAPSSAPEALAPGPSDPIQPSYITVTGSDGAEATVLQSPTRVAIYDYSVLDILESVGYEKAGIEVIVVPAKDKLPTELSFYQEQGDDKVVSGGSLFYLDWDVLDLVQPEVVILGARSFGMSASGDRLDTEGKEKYAAETKQRYADTAFVKLSMNTSNSQLLQDMESNVTALAAIFPQLGPDLNAKLEEIKAEMAAIQAKAQASGKTALFCMMVDQTTLSVFNPDSRFDMLYEEFGFTPAAQEAVSWEDQHGFDVRAEYVLEVNPEVIFLLDRSGTVGTGAGAENFLNDSIIARTEAAKNGNIYVLSGNAWYTMTGGFASAEAMIADISQYTDTLK